MDFNRAYTGLGMSDWRHRSTDEALLENITGEFIDSRLQYLSLNPALLTAPDRVPTKGYVDQLVANAVIGEGVGLAAGQGLSLSGSTLNIRTSPSINVDGQNRIQLADGSVDSSKLTGQVLALSNTTESTSTSTGSMVLSGGLAYRGAASGESIGLFSNGGAGNQRTTIRFSPWSDRPGLHSCELAGVDNAQGGGYLSLRAALGSGAPVEALRIGQSGVTAFSPLLVQTDATTANQVPRLSQMQSAISTAVSTRESPLSFTGPNLVRTGNTVAINTVPTFQAVVLTGQPVNPPDAVSMGWVNGRITESTNGLQQSITAGTNLFFSSGQTLGVVSNPVFGVVTGQTGTQSSHLTTLAQVQALVSTKGDPVQITGSSNLTISGSTIGTTPIQSYSQLSLTGTEQSVSPQTGSLRIAGGLGVSKDIRCSGSVTLDTENGSFLNLFSPTGGNTQCGIRLAPWTGRVGLDGNKTAVEVMAVDDQNFSAFLRFSKSEGQSGAMQERLRVDGQGCLVTGHVRCTSTATSSAQLPNLGQVQSMIAAIPPPTPGPSPLFGTTTMLFNVNSSSSNWQTRQGGETSSVTVEQVGTPQFTEMSRGVLRSEFNGVAHVEFAFISFGSAASTNLTMNATRTDLSASQRGCVVAFHNVTGIVLEYSSTVMQFTSGTEWYFEGRSSGIGSGTPPYVHIRLRRLL